MAAKTFGEWWSVNATCMIDYDVVKAVWDAAIESVEVAPSASTIEQYLASCCHHGHYHDLIREGWEAKERADARLKVKEESQANAQQAKP